MENSLQLFNFNDTPIRTVKDGDDVWFVAKDVCEALGITWKRTASLASIPDEWRGGWEFQLPSGIQEMTVISEPAVYMLAFRSRRPEAVAFTRWVAEEVLPSIRKTGRYEVPRLRHGDPRPLSLRDLHAHQRMWSSAYRDNVVSLTAYQSMFVPVMAASLYHNQLVSAQQLALFTTQEG